MTSLGAVPVILFSVLCSSSAHLLLKIGADSAFAGTESSKRELALAAITNPWLWGGLTLHGVALLTWVYALGKTQLSFAYPFIALGFVFTAVFSWFFMNESLGAMRLSGMGMIIIGLLLVARG